MGGAGSRFDETDWDATDGGLRDVTETLDGSQPVSRHAIVTLTKHSTVNQREYDIRDHQDILLYTTKAVEGTVKWFDLLGKGNERLLRVQTDTLRLNWEIFSFGKPNFPGQQPDDDASQQAGEALYRKANVNITWNKYHGHVYMYGPSKEVQKSLVGVVQSDDPILEVEEIRSLTAQYQSYRPKGINVPHPPLVGYWVWENTLKVHKMKMHLAKGTDMALHCVLAVLTNMVRTERNAAGTQ